MNMRLATEDDTSPIVDLLKVSMKGSMIPKTERYWRWKHQENPFGKSYVFVAENESGLIGIRTFMQWQWRNQDREFKAVRAVDTATHPEHQGKGVFRELNTTLVDLVMNEGIDFVFNTPNEKTLSGNLKMGWEKAYKTPLRLKLRSFMKKSSRVDSTQFELSRLRSDHIEDFMNKSKGSGMIYPRGYIQWRYIENPICRYYGFQNLTPGSEYLCIFRVKERSLFKELRICELMIEGQNGLSLFRRDLCLASTSFGCRVITCGHYTGQVAKQWLNRCWFTPALPLGLQMTYRKLNTDPAQFFMPWRNLKLPIGAFELF